MFKPNHLAIALSLSTITLLPACGGGGGSTAPLLEGTAAIGAAIDEGIVTAICADGSGFQQAVTTNAQGKWTGTLSRANVLPCAIKVSFGDPTKALHSFATSLGTINITPLTELVLAKTLGQHPGDWFTSSPTSLIAAAELEASTVDLLQTLGVKNFKVPATGSPFTTAFNANGTGWDALLDEIKESISDYEGFVEDIANGSASFDDIPTAPTEPTVAAPTGNGAALDGQNGATATVGSTNYTYIADPEDKPYVYNPLTDGGAFVVSDGSSVVTRWQFGGLTSEKGLFQCDSSNNAAPTIMLTLSGAPHLAQKCVLEVLSVSALEIEGRFTATFDLGETTDGYFRYKTPVETPTDELQADEFGYSMYIDGVLVKNNEVPPLDGYDRPVGSYLTLGDTPRFKLHMIPEAVSGNYICGQNGPYRTVEMSYSPALISGHGSQNATYPGSCTIAVSYIDGIYSGTFSGTLYNADGEKIDITNGVFRNDGRNL